VDGGNRLEDAVKDLAVDGRAATVATIPGHQPLPEVGHEDGRRRSVGRGAQVGGRERRPERARRRSEDGLAEGVIPRRAGDPVRGPGGPLQDEPEVAAIQQGQLCPRPAVVGKRLLLDARQAMRRQQLIEPPGCPR
jgi:hypothetical protein